MIRTVVSGLLIAGVGCLSGTGQTWGPSGSAVDIWVAGASSSDGRTIVAATQIHGLFISTNSGASWLTPTNLVSGMWEPITYGIHFTSLACSGNASKIVASANIGTALYVSADSGKTWSQLQSPNALWTAVCAATNGSNWAATASDGGGIFISRDGSNWTETFGGVQDWTSIAASGDGRRMVAASDNFDGYLGGIYLSTNFGTNWTESTNLAGTNWSAVASSADGSKLFAGYIYGGIYSSTNYGSNWVARNVPTLNWRSIACSSDGSRVVACSSGAPDTQYPGVVYTSTNFGASWTSNAVPNSYWQSATCSADGNWMAACDGDGQVWTSPPSSSALSIGSNRGTNNITITGLPTYQYSVQWTDDLLRGTWVDLKTNVFDGTGIWNLTDTPGNGTARYYRSILR